MWGDAAAGGRRGGEGAGWHLLRWHHPLPFLGAAQGSLVGPCSSPEGWRMTVEARKECGHQLSSPCEGDGTLPGMHGWRTCLCTSSHMHLSEPETLLCCSPSIYCSLIFAVTPEKISPNVFSISLQDLPSWQEHFAAAAASFISPAQNTRKLPGTLVGFLLKSCVFTSV